MNGRRRRRRNHRQRISDKSLYMLIYCCALFLHSFLLTDNVLWKPKRSRHSGGIEFKREKYKKQSVDQKNMKSKEKMSYNFLISVFSSVFWVSSDLYLKRRRRRKEYHIKVKRYQQPSYLLYLYSMLL